MPRPNRNMTRVSFHIGQDQHKRLEAMGKSSGLPLAELMRRAISVFFLHLDNRKENQ